MYQLFSRVDLSAIITLKYLFQSNAPLNVSMESAKPQKLARASMDGQESSVTVVRTRRSITSPCEAIYFFVRDALQYKPICKN